MELMLPECGEECQCSSIEPRQELKHAHSRATNPSKSLSEKGPCLWRSAGFQTCCIADFQVGSTPEIESALE